MNRVALLALILSAAGPVHAAEMITPSMQPSRAECESVRNFNGDILKTITKVHQECLDRPRSSGEESNYSRSSPCSRLICRDLHLRMDAISKANSQINSECTRRASRGVPIPLNQPAPASEPPPPGDHDRDRQTWFERWKSADNAVSTVMDLNRVRKDPAYLMEMAWGAAAGKIREEAAHRLSLGATSSTSLGAEVMRYVFDRAQGQMLEASRNPIARILNEAMLNRLYIVYAQSLGQLDAAFDDFDNSMKKDAQRTSRRTSNYSTTLRIPERSSQCSVFDDPQRNAELYKRNPGGWVALLMKCGKQH